MLRLFSLWRWTGKDLRLLWFALEHPSRPAWLWPAVLALGLYAFDPFNFFVPILGAADDLVLLPLLLHGMMRMLPGEVRSDFDRSQLMR
jgi:uncharacterized membrane protein YkvA (DUF1232 family)